jgi:hypothetical protein
VLVRAAGVDLAAEPVRDGGGGAQGDDGKAVVEDLRVGADDEAVLAALATADKAGIDAPFGWPDASAAFLAAHQAGDVPVPGGLSGQQWRRQLARRHTDETVRAVTGIIPLGVAADRIGRAAMRCAGLPAKPGNAGASCRPRRLRHGGRGLPGGFAEAAGAALARVQAAAQPWRTDGTGDRTADRRPVAGDRPARPPLPHLE